jgi:hypothetical protein
MGKVQGALLELSGTAWVEFAPWKARYLPFDFAPLPASAVHAIADVGGSQGQ